MMRSAKMADSADNLPMLRHYRAWLEPDGGCSDNEREDFYASGLVVLDTNVLLDLYRYTPSARGQVLAALNLVSDRLWLPHQVGLEFVRGRNRVIYERAKALNDAQDQIQRRFHDAWKALASAVNHVKGLLAQYAADEDGQSELDELINQQQFQQLVAEWKQELLRRTNKLKDDQDVELGAVASGSDAILPKIAALYGDRIGAPPSADDLRRLVEEAVTFRYPNEIPPGFLDLDKETAVKSAGDFLLWEELIAHARNLSASKRVLFVSGDVKEDWYEPSEPGQGKRPWPLLFEELRSRADADLLIVQPKNFFEGVKEYLNAEITPSTVEEIGRATESRVNPEVPYIALVSSKEAVLLPPPDGLALSAYRAARLSTSAIRSILGDTAHHMFQWWLIGVTVELGLRAREDDEPQVDVEAAVRSSMPPAPDWSPGTVLAHGEWPYRTSSWVAPWLEQMVKATPAADRVALLRLAVRQVRARTGEEEVLSS
jgi:hypothetical protein